MLPFFQSNIASLIDARKRFLAPGGALIPERDDLYASIVEAADLYKPYVTPWDDNPYDIAMDPARRLVMNTLKKARVSREQLLVEPQHAGTIDYYTVESLDFCAELNWVVARPGMAHALAVWFDSVLANGVGFSNAPGLPELIYGNAFFPLIRPIPLEAGDEISVSLKADLVGDDYIWSWNTRMSSRDGKSVKADFKQSTFYGVSLTPAALRRRAANFEGTLNEDGQKQLFVLSRLNGHTSLDEIARQVTEQFPGRFRDQNQALAYVSDLSSKYC